MNIDEEKGFNYVLLENKSDFDTGDTEYEPMGIRDI